MTDQNQISPSAPAPQSPLQPVNNIPDSQPPEAPFIPMDTPVPSVVIPQPATQSGIPRWFYLVFSTTIFLFVSVTTLLLLSFFQKQGFGNDGNATMEAALPAPTVASIPTVTPRQATDELTDIEADLMTISFSEIKQKIEELSEEESSVSASL